MTTENEEVPTTGDEDRDVKILLADHAQSREEARYRDRLFYEILIGVVVFIGILINALIGVDCYQMRLVIFAIAFVIFFILSAATWSIKVSREGAWKHSGEIEADERLEGLLKTNETIENAEPEGNCLTKLFAKWFASVHVGTLICWLVTFLTALSLGGVVFASIRLA